MTTPNPMIIGALLAAKLKPAPTQPRRDKERPLSKRQQRRKAQKLARKQARRTRK